MITVDASSEPIETQSVLARSYPAESKLADAIQREARVRGRVLERDGLSISGLGTAISFERLSSQKDAAHVEGVLHELGHHGDTELEPIALGALRFDPDADNTLHVAKVTLVRRANESACLIVVGKPGESPLDLQALLEREVTEEQAHGAPDRFRLDSVVTHEQFLAEVARALVAIRSKAFKKVVLAREVVVEANRPYLQVELVERLRSLHPSCFAFAVDGLLGASPELVLRKEGTKLTSAPLAGTIARSGDPTEDHRLAGRLMTSTKDRNEHRFVVDAIAEVLAAYSTEVEVPTTPHVLELRNVVHLATFVSATLDRIGTNVLEIAAALHPTPAICGTPREAAYRYLTMNESLDRGYYGGLVGYLDGNGDGEWWLSIRSAMIEANRARLLAGVGIVEGSDPSAELAETQLKLQAMLAVLVRP